MSPEKVDKVTTEGKKGDAQRLYVVTVPMGGTDEEQHRILHDIKGLRLQCRDGTAFRFAFEQGKVGSDTPAEPYHTVLANSHVLIKNLDVKELHLYLACGSADKVAEVIVWK